MDLQRLDKRIQSRRRTQATLHDMLTGAGADYTVAAEFNAVLKGVAAELETAELAWLDTAERLQPGASDGTGAVAPAGYARQRSSPVFSSASHR